MSTNHISTKHHAVTAHAMPYAHQFWGILLVVLVALALFNVYVSLRLIVYRGYTKSQKFWQFLILWAVPLFGGILVRSVMSEPVFKERDTAFTPAGGDNPPGIGTGGV